MADIFGSDQRERSLGNHDRGGKRQFTVKMALFRKKTFQTQTETVETMNAIIISIGDELILGQTVDSNSAWLSARLARLGISVAEHITVGDDVDAIESHLRRVSQQSDFIIATGGLGPTEDDLTRYAVAKALGVELELDESSLGCIEDFFARRGKVTPQTNRIQAMIPVGCRAIENNIGTAPGISGRIGSALAFFLPGVPAEMKKMFAESIEEQLEEISRERGQNEVLICRKIHTFGAGESAIAQIIGDMMVRGANPLLNITASQGIVSFRINARASDQAAGRKLIEPVEKQLRDKLGAIVFGADNDTLASVVGQLLRQQGARLAVAESCTGGLLAKYLTDTSGASDYFTNGWVVYSNQAKCDLLNVDPDIIERHGAVSEEVACQLATNARNLSQSDYALAITGIAGPTGATADKPIGLVYIGLAEAEKVTVERYVFPGSRQMIRQRAAYNALDILRLQLI